MAEHHHVRARFAFAGNDPFPVDELELAKTQIIDRIRANCAQCGEFQWHAQPDNGYIYWMLEFSGCDQGSALDGRPLCEAG